MTEKAIVGRELALWIVSFNLAFCSSKKKRISGLFGLLLNETN